ncbi:MAG: LptF/LptG family permease [Caulobacteraceae bacterium]
MSAAPIRMQAYVLGRFLIGIAAALAVIASVIVLIDFVELSRTLGGRLDLTFVDLLYLTLLKSPAIILLVLPFVFLFGTMGAFVAMNRRSELVAMRAAGVSAWRFILPAAAMALLIGVLTTTVLNPAAAALNQRFEDRQTALTEDPQAGPDEIWLRQGDDRQQVVIHAKSHDTVNDVVRLRGVSVFIEDVDPSGELTFTRRLEASEASLMPGYWRLTDVRESLPGSSSVHSDRILIPSMLDHRTAMEKFISPAAVAFWRLPSTIHSAELAGYSSTGYRMRLQQLLAAPVLFAAMTVLGAAFSLRLMRLGDLAALVGAGVTLGFVLFFLDEFCGALGAAEVIPPDLAAWSPPILALLAGITLLCYTEDG